MHHPMNGTEDMFAVGMLLKERALRWLERN